MKLAEFEKKLKSQDWTYEMSDDSSQYHKGHQSDLELRAEAKEVGLEGVRLYNDYYERYSYPKGNPIRD